MPECDPLLTISALNMAVVSLHRITTSGERLTLNHEYDNIINNLRMSEINAYPELTELYQDIVSVIHKGSVHKGSVKDDLEKVDSEKKHERLNQKSPPFNINCPH